MTKLEPGEGSLYDVIIAGGASAGLTAALYSSRQGLKTLLVTKDLGGQALLTNEIQNYPGYENIGGFELMGKFEEQARSYGAEILYDEVVEIVRRDDFCFIVKTLTNSFQSFTLILAFGKTPRDLGVPGEQEMKGRGVSYCAICDGSLFKGREVAVVGSAEPALDAALLLSNIASRVYVIFSLDRLVGPDEKLEALKSKDNVEFVPNSMVLRINGSIRVESLTIIDSKTREEKEMPVGGVFIELGYMVKTDFVKDLVQLNGRKEIIINKDGSTSQPGVFAAGDVTDTPYKQVVISAGQGAVAALSAYNYLQKLKGRPAVRGDWKS
mgnify:CR=1 FL=1